ncbi:hypothetical protein ACLOJK_012478 [Asimina triloba]
MVSAIVEKRADQVCFNDLDRKARVKKAKELQIKTTKALSRKEAERVGVKVSLAKNFKTMLIETEDRTGEGQAKVIEHKTVSAGGQAAGEKRSQFFIPKANHTMTSTNRDIKEIFKWSYNGTRLKVGHHCVENVYEVNPIMSDVERQKIITVGTVEGRDNVLLEAKWAMEKTRVTRVVGQQRQKEPRPFGRSYLSQGLSGRGWRDDSAL